MRVAERLALPKTKVFFVALAFEVLDFGCDVIFDQFCVRPIGAI